jgi:hypothetical protein
MAYDLPQVVPDGIIEDFISPSKLGDQEFPDGCVAEEILVMTQDAEGLARELGSQDMPLVVPGGIVEQFIFPFGAAESLSEEAVASASQETSETMADEDFPIVSGGIIEQFINPSNHSVAVSSKAEEGAEKRREITAETSAKKTETSNSIGEEMAKESTGSLCSSEKRWYFEFKPGYLFFTDQDMQNFYNKGGFTFRVEGGCKVWGPMIVWFDGGYFQKAGKAIGGGQDLEIKLATITLGLKGIHYFSSYAAIYAGAGPRLFMMMVKNDSPFVRGDDNEIGIGGGFDAGFWLFPIPRWKNFFLDLFVDYSWKKMKVEPDEISSFDFDVDVSSLSLGAGLGIKF